MRGLGAIMGLGVDATPSDDCRQNSGKWKAIANHEIAVLEFLLRAEEAAAQKKGKVTPAQQKVFAQKQAAINSNKAWLLGQIAKCSYPPSLEASYVSTQALVPKQSTDSSGALIFGPDEVALAAYIAIFDDLPSNFDDAFPIQSLDPHNQFVAATLKKYVQLHGGPGKKTDPFGGSNGVSVSSGKIPASQVVEYPGKPGHGESSMSPICDKDTHPSKWCQKCPDGNYYPLTYQCCTDTYHPRETCIKCKDGHWYGVGQVVYGFDGTCYPAFNPDGTPAETPSQAPATSTGTTKMPKHPKAPKAPKKPKYTIPTSLAPTSPVYSTFYCPPGAANPSVQLPPNPTAADLANACGPIAAPQAMVSTPAQVTYGVNYNPAQGQGSQNYGAETTAPQTWRPAAPVPVTTYPGSSSLPVYQGPPASAYNPTGGAQYGPMNINNPGNANPGQQAMPGQPGSSAPGQPIYNYGSNPSLTQLGPQGMFNGSLVDPSLQPMFGGSLVDPSLQPMFGGQLVDPSLPTIQQLSGMRGLRAIGDSSPLKSMIMVGGAFAILYLMMKKRR